jgi:hypothetical protein
MSIEQSPRHATFDEKRIIFGGCSIYEDKMIIKKVLISGERPECCEKCERKERDDSHGTQYYCDLVLMYIKYTELRPDWCPLEEVEQGVEPLPGFYITIRGSGTPDDFREFAKRVQAEFKKGEDDGS